MQDEKLSELKAALDASYLSKQKDYEVRGITKEDFYKNALNRIELLLKDGGYKAPEQIEDDLSFITRGYRASISENVFSNANYIKDIYDYATLGEAKYINQVVSYKEMRNRIIEKFNKMNEDAKKRKFSKEADYIDSFLSDVKTKYRVELLKRVMNNDKSFNIHFPSKKFNELYESDLDRLKLLLLDNAYRVYVVTHERSGDNVWRMLSDKEGPEIVQEFQRNSKILDSYMSEVHNVAEYVSRLNHHDLEMLINIYVLSLNSRRNNDLIRYADTINSSYGDRFEVFKQLESLETIDEIKKINNQGYNY